MTKMQRKAARKSTVLMSAFGTLLFLTGTSAARCADAFALVGEANGNLDRLDITTGTNTVIRSNIGVYNGLAYNSNETILYGAVSPSASVEAISQLVTINPATGVNTVVGSDGVGLTTITNLADGRLFGVDFDDGLYEINSNTGATTLIGATGLPSLTASSSSYDNSLASDGTALYYTLDTNGGDSSLYTLSLTTGVATLIGSTGTSGIDGSAFAGPTFGTGQLYGFYSDGDTAVINLSTGAATILNNNGLTDIFGGVGIVTAAAPEPPAETGLALGFLGLAGLVIKARRRRSAA